MVGLAKQLQELLLARQKNYGGQDIKNITESILMAERAESVSNNEEAKKEYENSMKALQSEWMNGGPTK